MILKSIVLYLFVALIVIMNLACNESGDKVINTQSLNKLQPKDSLETKVDTVFRDYLQTDFFNEHFSFGMPLSTWNRKVSELVRERIYYTDIELKQEITAIGIISGSEYIAVSNNRSQNGFATDYKLSGDFVSSGMIPFSNRFLLLRISGVIQNEPILREIRGRVITSSSDLVYSIYDSILLNSNFIAGDSITIYGQNSIFTPIDIEEHNAKEIELRGEVDSTHLDNILGRRSYEELQRKTKSLYESQRFYLAIETEVRQLFTFDRDLRGNITNLSEGLATWVINMKFISKRFSGVDVKEYETPIQRERTERRRRTDSLIRLGALNN
jgi:hypothetical protein